MARAFASIVVVLVVVVVVAPKNGVNNTRIYLSRRDKSPVALRRSVYYANQGAISIGAHFGRLTFSSFALSLHRLPLAPCLFPPAALRRSLDNRSRALSRSLIFSLLSRAAAPVAFGGPDTAKTRVASRSTDESCVVRDEELFFRVLQERFCFFFVSLRRMLVQLSGRFCHRRDSLRGTRRDDFIPHSADRKASSSSSLRNAPAV